jgi:hypothetical protein
VKTTLPATPIYTSISIALPPWLQKAPVKISKAFQWSGSDVAQGGKCAVAWCRVAHPQNLGGPGILNLNLMGLTLRLRWLWLSRTDPTRSWAALPINEDAMTTTFFKASIHCAVGNGCWTMLLDRPLARWLMYDLRHAWSISSGGVMSTEMISVGCPNQWCMDSWHCWCPHDPGDGTIFVASTTFGGCPSRAGHWGAGDMALVHVRIVLSKLGLWGHVLRLVRTAGHVSIEVCLSSRWTQVFRLAHPPGPLLDGRMVAMTWTAVRQ